MKKYGVFPFAVFAGAFLLFQIQPMIGKYFLPWFGGSPAVWMSCLMSFQLFLLGGYSYAHWLQRFSPRRQVTIHLSLLAAALAGGVCLYFLWGNPVLPSMNWRPEYTSHPGMYLLFLLLISIGVPYFILSTSASLLQAWFHQAEPARSPYVFYIVSNAASILALLSYPFLIEPVFTLKTQALLWSGGFVLYVILCLFSARRVRPVAAENAKKTAIPKAKKPEWKEVSCWIVLSACGVLTLMAITNQMTQDIPPVPFLWVLPLTLYLLTYIIAFTDRLRRVQPYYVYLIPLACGIAWVLTERAQTLKICLQMAGYGAILFSICLFYHSTLYQRKPAPEQLTFFYLSISLGGALGGIFVTVFAPYLFPQYWEHQIAMIAGAVLAVVSVYRGGSRLLYPLRHALWLAVIILIAFFLHTMIKQNESIVYTDRNFFGTLAVEQCEGSQDVEGGGERQFPIFILLHGRTQFGLQMGASDLRKWPTSYFSRTSGAGLAILNHPKRLRGKSMRVGVLGLGVGTIAAYGRPGDFYRFYEIDPHVIWLAQHSPWFSYLADSEADIQVVDGDGRISMENELKKESENYDVLVLDVFNGDQIPVHILTEEAFKLYLDHLAEGGVIAVHISSRYLNLFPVLHQVQKRFGLYAARIEDRSETKVTQPSDWVLLSRDRRFMNQPAIARADSPQRKTVRPIRLWTDNYANLMDVIRY